MIKNRNNCVVEKSNIIKNGKIISSVLLTSIILSACGGGSESTTTTPQNPPVVITPPVTTNPTPVEPPVIDPPVTNPETPPIINNPPVEQPTTPPVIVSQKITTMTMTNNSGITQTEVPITFGQVFSVGVLKTNESIAGKLSDGSTIPLQMDVKATHSDGSIRHAVISAILPSQSANESVSMDLVKTTTAQNTTAINIQDLMNAGFSANVKVKVGNTEYSAVAEDLLKSGKTKLWLSGATTTEWLVSTPLKTSSGIDHPQLSARFAIRAYKGLKQAKVDVIVENTWAYEPSPQNVIYDVSVNIGNKEVYSKQALNHFTHARWRKSFWWGNEPPEHVSHDPRYLIDTKAIPNYDPTVKISQNELNSIKSRFTGAVTEPMANGLAAAYMPMTGGRPDIGLIPGWAVSYLLSQDKDAKNATLGTADLAGSWSAHYRDKNTDRPIDLFDYPYMTILGHPGDTYNPVTKKQEYFPACGGTCSNTNTTDGSHTPAFAYLPYLVTGDYYYLEELEFWAMYHAFASNPGYRENIKGLVHPEQVRGQAWNLRTIGEAAYIVPDNDPLKPHFNTIVSNNLDWYIKNYAQNSAPQNQLGAILHGYAMAYSGGTGLAPWQDDFFTQAIGHLYELGFSKAKIVLDWKARFPVSRMTDSGFCWVSGAIYSLKVKDTADSPDYSDWATIYSKNLSPEVVATTCGSQDMANAMQKDYPGIKAGEMTGYASSNAGYPSNMQPALAYSVDSGINNAAKAWSVFMNRKVLPDYQNGAQFAIVPRNK